jgi:hypothetical protein
MVYMHSRECCQVPKVRTREQLSMREPREALACAVPAMTQTVRSQASGSLSACLQGRGLCAAASLEQGWRQARRGARRAS